MTNNHYYTNNDKLMHQRKSWRYTLRGHELTFISDNGVFSKNTVDFGSKVLIETFHMSKEDSFILDVGCGYGPIGLAIAKACPTSQVDMVDVNLRALELTKENAVINQIKNISAFSSSIYENVSKKAYQAIVSNPPIRAGKEVVHAILAGAYDHLSPNGELWIVIQKKQGAPSAMKKMEEVFGNAEVVRKVKGYYILKSIKA
ncbi:class I SAM-dependent methyltransferase [Listeria sp. PSOL-1]|uniref:class I SAM-dependent methyltransferase n=1 Tax=Listeria sp. PSOL-1 TaxID=1844999 RepID=UPI0013D5E05B|nr:class I SAM-dependent methyltransferase [Listeria sp. PSOL-1]